MRRTTKKTDGYVPMQNPQEKGEKVQTQSQAPSNGSNRPENGLQVEFNNFNRQSSQTDEEDGRIGRGINQIRVGSGVKSTSGSEKGGNQSQDSKQKADGGTDGNVVD